jgi:signal transduction histidine kinase
MGVQLIRAGSAARLAAAHRRFVRASVLIYLGSAGVATTMLVAALSTDRAHEVRDLREHALLETQLRAEYLGGHLALLAKELQRLALRSQSTLLGPDLQAVQSLMQLSHDRSSFFNTGVAIIATDGHVLWSLPSSFLRAGTSFAGHPWFRSLAEHRRPRFVPVDPERQDALIYVVTPIIRERRLDGALLGAIDLAKSSVVELEPSGGPHRPINVLATLTGDVVYPPRPPAFATDPEWRSLFSGEHRPHTFVADRRLSGQDWLITAAQLPGTRMLMVGLTRHDLLLGPPRLRLVVRLVVGVALVLAAMGLLVPMLVRSLRIFRRAETEAVREEQLQRLGEATNLIAHEVKNALNGMRLGVDVLLRAGKKEGAGEPRSAQTLRDELQRLSAFTDELLIFSKGIVPRPGPLELTGLVRSVDELMQSAARDLEVTLELRLPEGELPLQGDARLLRVVINNLVMNALEAASASRATRPPKVTVEVIASPKELQVLVSDSGAGVVDSVRERLFEPFITGKPSGVGIGLALSRRIAIAHGGDLRLQSSNPTRFALVIPGGAQRIHSAGGESP